MEVTVEPKLNNGDDEKSPSRSSSSDKHAVSTPKGPKKFKFSSSRKAVAIGREGVFDLHISDSRVSRCHGRIFVSSQCKSHGQSTPI
jgi:hypothetical protein